MDVPEGMDPDEREMRLKIKAMAERFQAEPWNMALFAELQEKVTAIVFEYELRKYLPDMDHAAYMSSRGLK